jgi:Ala-tRNA(Pro) deacylase
VPGERLAKGVVLRSGTGYILAVLPSSRRVAMEAIEKVTGGSVELASEDEVSMLFPDCEKGAVPVFGEAYGIPAMIEETLDDSRDIYCEGGDHRSLVHMDGRDFRTLMAGAERARIAA